MAYSSPYYDPAKAHEYYMRNRQLKGYANRYGGARGNGTSAASGGLIPQSSTPAPTSTMPIKQKITNQAQVSNQSTNNASSYRISMSKLNEKGIKAIDDLKQSMEAERSEMVKKANDAVDKRLLSDAKKIQIAINKIRETGQNVNSAQFLSRINTLLAKTKQIKRESSKKIYMQYAEKYKKQLENLTKDKTLYKSDD